MPLIEPSARKQKVHVITPKIGLPSSTNYHPLYEFYLLWRFEGYFKPVNAAKRISISTTNYSVFQSLFSIPII